jgi:hypothetical protein
VALGSREGHRAAVIALLASATALLLLLLAVSGRPREFPFAKSRYWLDMSVATRLFLDSAFPAEEGVPSPEDAASRAAAGRLMWGLVVGPAAEEGIGPGAFWRTLPKEPFLRRRRLLPRTVHPLEDPGRAALLAVGFRALHGVAPRLLAWMGAFVCAPALAWTVWELCWVGRFFAAGVFAVFVSLSAYLVDCLTLPDSGIAFYLTALLALMALGIRAFLGGGGGRGLLVRTAAAALVLAVCAASRSGTLLLVPGFALALWGAARRPARVAGLVLVLLGPFLLVKPSTHHNLWIGVWEGLGDFDRTLGHSWNDDAALGLLKGAGIDPRGHKSPLFWSQSAGDEAFFRSLCLDEIRSHPGWYAGILARRVFATLTLEKLWPWGPLSGHSMTPGTTPNEGRTDQYWGLAPNADIFAFGSRELELPIPLLLAPTLVLVWWGVRRSEWRALLALAPPALGCLVLPVVITTAGGLETEAIALVYLLGAALCLDEAVGRLRGGPTPAGAPG